MLGIRGNVEAIANPLRKRSSQLPTEIRPRMICSSRFFPHSLLRLVRNVTGANGAAPLKSRKSPFLLLGFAHARCHSFFNLAPESGSPILPIVSRKSKPSVGIDRLARYVACVLRRQESKDAGNFLSGRRLS